MEDKGANMIRKLMMVAAAAAVPLGAIAVGAVGGGVAGAAVPIPVTPVTCGESGTINFQAPGISLAGTATTSHTTTTTTSTSFVNCTGGAVTGGGSLVILTKNTKCTASTSPPPGCMKGLFVGNSGGGLASPATDKSIMKAVKKLPLGMTQNSVPFAIKNKPLSVAEVVGGACTNGATQEVGFSITGAIKMKPKETGITTGTLTVCIGQDNLGGNFFTDLTAGHSISSAQIDPVTSTISLH
jgi:hypothetical protein